MKGGIEVGVLSGQALILMPFWHQWIATGSLPHMTCWLSHIAAW